jgi:hypothetical protein
MVSLHSPPVALAYPFMCLTIAFPPAFRSSRFYRLLTSGSAVFKMTIFPDWNQVSLGPGPA